MSRPKKATPVERLMAAMDRCALTRANAMYTMAQRESADAYEESRLFTKMTQQLAENDRAEGQFRRLATKLLREASRRSSVARGGR